MTRTQYRNARRLVRDNGHAAYAWIAKSYGQAFADKLLDLQVERDWLQERANIVAWCKAEGATCTVRHTRPIREYLGGRWLGAKADTT